MCVGKGGHSFHKKDWIKTAAIAAAAVAAPYAIGALAPAAGAAGAEAAGAGVAGDTLAGGLGAGAAGEMGATSSSIGAAGAPANPLSIGFGNFMSAGPGQYAGTAMKGLSMAQKAGLLGSPSGGAGGGSPGSLMQPPSQGMAPTNTNVSGISNPSSLFNPSAVMAQLSTMSPDDPRRMQLLALLQQQPSMGA